MLSSRNRYTQNDESRRDKSIQQPKPYYSSEDEDEEDEQERLLSEQFGEATEANNISKKRKTNENKEDDQDLEKDFANAAVKKPRLLRPKFEPSHLIGPKGLIQMKNDMPGILERHTAKLVSGGGKRKRQKQSPFQYHSEASFGKALISTYKQFCHNLYPHLAFEDLLLRIEKFGSKKEVKDYIQSMREDTRRFNLEKLYGMEKADRILKNFDDFRNMDVDVFQNPDDVELEERNELHDKSPHENASGDKKSKNPISKMNNNTNLDEGETEAIFEEETNSQGIDEKSGKYSKNDDNNKEVKETKNSDFSEMDNIVQDSEFVSNETKKNSNTSENTDPSKFISLHNINTKLVNDDEKDVINQNSEDSNVLERKETINAKSYVTHNSNEEIDSLKTIDKNKNGKKDESGDTILVAKERVTIRERKELKKDESQHVMVDEIDLLQDTKGKENANDKYDDQNGNQSAMLKETTIIEQQDDSEELVLDFSQIPSQENDDNDDEGKVGSTNEIIEKCVIETTVKNDGKNNSLDESEEIVIDSSQISIQGEN